MYGMRVTLAHDDGPVQVHVIDDERMQIVVGPAASSRTGGSESCETRYPLELIEAILSIKGPAYLCDEIARDEDPEYIEGMLIPDILGFVPRDEVNGTRVLDFGCGSGSSTMVLARNFPQAEIMGVDLLADSLEIAQMRAKHYETENVSFRLSPSAGTLPADIGTFDNVVLSAVFEHLLPQERPAVMEQIWGLLRPGGVLFLDQTPHRYFPIEHHTTHLPGLNYLPRAMAARYARIASRRVDRHDSWEAMLRNGIRGGTEKEVVRLLARHGSSPLVQLRPTAPGLDDRSDLWLQSSSFRAYPRARRLIWRFSKLSERLAGEPLVPYIALAIRKACSDD
jgi:2-polyprenyl-3-methyl-5-hydroxy-6-metoxy-1,4-benzoquinol methylase